MKLYFYGADRCVTGSCHMLEAAGKKILVDCGLQQGRDEFDNEDLPFYPGEIDYVIVTHAHIDHSGRIPLLVKRGFQGVICSTRITAELMEIMLLDSAHIQESDAEYQNRKGLRAGRAPVEPLYTVADAELVKNYVRTFEYGEHVELAEGIRICFSDAGHLLGSGSVTVSVTESGVTKEILFSGDIGNINQPIIRDPQPLCRADYVIMESTYGNRNHQPPKSYTEDLARIIDETISRGGNVVIPAFAVGRTQEILYFIREIKEENLAPRAGNFPVYIDSPLAGKSTKVFSGDLRGYLDDEALELVRGGESMFSFPGLYMTTTSEESKALNFDPTPKVIISASGMCDAGRIRHHLKHNLWSAKNTVVFVGFQSPGSLGRHLLDGAESVKLFGEEIAVQAQIVNFQGLSSHADHDHLLMWLGHVEPKPEQVFVVHGDVDVAPAFAAELQSLGYAAHAPLYLESYDLLANEIVEQGIVRQKAERRTPDTAAYQRLVEVGQRVAAAIRGARGRDNKTLNNFARKLLEVLDWFEK